MAEVKPTNIMKKLTKEIIRLDKKVAKHNIFVNIMMHAVAVDAATKHLEEIVSLELSKAQTADEIENLRSGLDHAINAIKYMDGVRYSITQAVDKLKKTHKFGVQATRAENGCP